MDSPPDTSGPEFGGIDAESCGDECSALCRAQAAQTETDSSRDGKSFDREGDPGSRRTRLASCIAGDRFKPRRHQHRHHANAVPALPADTNAPGYPVAPAAVPQTAFQARDVAEAALSPTIIAPTGKASLLKIIGQHDPSSPSPTTWRFYFYDTGKLGNALYLTVRDGKVVKDGQALTGAVFPWHQDDILPEDKLKVDSSVALATAEALIPGVAVSSSSFELVHARNEAPMWKLTLWTRDPDGSEKELGTAMILTDTGYVLSSSLYPPKE
jgi:hypothetical protein